MIVNTHDAKSQLSKLIERAANGEEIIIGKAGKPMARLVAYREDKAPRRPGLWRGQVRIDPDFDTTPPDVLDAFEAQ